MNKMNGRKVISLWNSKYILELWKLFVLIDTQLVHLLMCYKAIWSMRVGISIIFKTYIPNNYIVSILILFNVYTVINVQIIWNIVFFYYKKWLVLLKSVSWNWHLQNKQRLNCSKNTSPNHVYVEFKYIPFGGHYFYYTINQYLWSKL